MVRAGFPGFPMDTFLKVLTFLGTLLEVILLFNLLILVHELGHYWAAKWRGLKVEKFQIWFGPPIWKKTINGVQWGLGSIPAGGFVALPQMAPMEAVEGKSPDGTDRKSLPAISPLDKIIVAFAGPLFSFLLAIAFAIVVWKVGRPVSSYETTTVIGHVAAGMPAAEAGIKVGDKILSIDGQPITSFFGLTDSVISGIALSEGNTVKITVQRPGVAEPMTLEMKPKAAHSSGVFDRGSVRKVGIGPSSMPIVADVLPGSPAAKAGLKAGDRVTAVDGQPIIIGEQVEAAGRERPGQDVILSVERSGADGKSETLQVAVRAVKPTKPEDLPALTGAAWKSEVVLSHPTPWEQIRKAGLTIFTTVKALVSPASDIGVKHLSGPIGIGGAFFDMLTADYGWRLALWFGVVVNVNLAHAQPDAPAHPRWRAHHAGLAGKNPPPADQREFLEYLQTAFALVLLSFMLYVTVLDVERPLERPERRGRPNPPLSSPIPRDPHHASHPAMSTLRPPWIDPYVRRRRPTREVRVGNVGIGGDNPIRVQSMITTDTHGHGGVREGRPCRWPRRAARSCGSPRRRARHRGESRAHRRRRARRGLRRAARRRHPFQAGRRHGGGEVGGEGPRQSRQLRGQEEVRRPRIHRRGIRGGTRRASRRLSCRWCWTARRAARPCASAPTTARSATAS